MDYSTKNTVQLISQLLLKEGVTDVVISPGSRNAPFTINFNNNELFKCYSVVDERAAGFFALGIAQQKRKPVVVCCTSGSAVVNYYPAIVEAFYQNIPLIVLSADRPSSMVDQFDGQTIRQQNVFDNHILSSFHVEDSNEVAYLEKNAQSLNEAIVLAKEKMGPIHFNFSFEEPLYDTQSKAIEFNFSSEQLKKIEVINKTKINQFNSLWNQSTRKIILVGLAFPNQKLNELLSKFVDLADTVVLTEVTSNVANEKFIYSIDQVLFSLEEAELKELQPDFLLTIGQNIVSKKVKAFLRSYQPENHWHIDEFWAPNTYNCLSESINVKPECFLKEITKDLKANESNYAKNWFDIKHQRETKHEEYLTKIDFCDFKAHEIIAKSIPENSIVHYSNSSPIRYAQIFAISLHASVKLFCNRGTSGIDGCTGTAIGSCVESEGLTTLITGDIGFFYDNNSLWNKHIPANFRLILINNGGGNIFKIIPGPSTSGALEQFFETKHELTAKPLAELHSFDYCEVNSIISLNHSLTSFYEESTRPKILEIDTKNIDNAAVLKSYFNFIK